MIRLPMLLMAAFAGVGAAPADPVEMVGPGTISTPVNEFGGTLTPDGNGLVFSASIHRSYMYGLYESRRTGSGAWTGGRLLPFSGRGRDFDLVFAPDGRTAFFVSDRPLPGEVAKAYNAWRVTWSADRGWSKPTPLPAPINRPVSARRTPGSHEWFISATSTGVLYFTSGDRDGGLGNADIWRAEPRGDGYADPVNLGPAINSPSYESESLISPDERFLLFSAADRPDGAGDWDIYVAFRKPNGDWTKARNLGPAINTPQRDYSPRLSPDSRTLYFTSERYLDLTRIPHLTYGQARAAHDERLNGFGNIYRVELRSLPAFLAAEQDARD